MRRIALSVFVVAVFIIYSFILRNQHAPSLVTPISIAHNKPTSNNQSKSTSSTKTTSITTTQVYKDGTYVGNSESAYYGNVEVSATIQSGKIVAVRFLEYPNEDQNSIAINQQAIPSLQQEAIKAQNAKVNIITGATFTSQAFTQSLSSALAKAS